MTGDIFLNMNTAKLSKTILILVMALLIVLSDCSKETASAEEGDTVRVHYTLTLEDGSVRDTSEGKDPLQFTIGNGQVIQGFGEAVIGMKVGETKTVTIPPEESYGLHDDDLTYTFNQSELAEGIEPEVGMELPFSTQSGAVVYYPIIALSESEVTVDVNHPLAGETLTFEIELVEIL